MGHSEQIRYNPKEKAYMIQRTHFPSNKTEWLPLSAWGLTKELETVALIFQEGDREGTGTFYKTTLKLTVAEKVKELYLVMSERRHVINPNTGHTRVYAAPVVRDISSGMSTFAVISPYLKNQDFHTSSQPHVMYVDIEASDAEEITKKEALDILETPKGCCGVYKDFRLEKRLY